MSAKMLQDFVSDLEAKLEQWVGELRQTLDFAKLEETLSERVHSLCAGLLEHLLNERLDEAEWLNELKQLGGRLGMRFKEYHKKRTRRRATLPGWGSLCLAGYKKRGA